MRKYISFLCVLFWSSFVFGFDLSDYSIRINGTTSQDFFMINFDDENAVVNGGAGIDFYAVSAHQRGDVIIKDFSLFNEIHIPGDISNLSSIESTKGQANLSFDNGLDLTVDIGRLQKYLLNDELYSFDELDQHYEAYQQSLIPRSQELSPGPYALFGQGITLPEGTISSSVSRARVLLLESSDRGGNGISAHEHGELVDSAYCVSYIIECRITDHDLPYTSLVTQDFFAQNAWTPETLVQFVNNHFSTINNNVSSPIKGIVTMTIGPRSIRGLVESPTFSSLSDGILVVHSAGNDRRNTFFTRDLMRQNDPNHTRFGELYFLFMGHEITYILDIDPSDIPRRIYDAALDRRVFYTAGYALDNDDNITGRDPSSTGCQGLPPNSCFWVSYGVEIPTVDETDSPDNTRLIQGTSFGPSRFAAAYASISQIYDMGTADFYSLVIACSEIPPSTITAGRVARFDCLTQFDDSGNLSLLSATKVNDLVESALPVGNSSGGQDSGAVVSGSSGYGDSGNSNDKGDKTSGTTQSKITPSDMADLRDALPGSFTIDADFISALNNSESVTFSVRSRERPHWFSAGVNAYDKEFYGFKPILQNNYNSKSFGFIYRNEASNCFVASTIGRDRYFFGSSTDFFNNITSYNTTFGCGFLSFRHTYKTADGNVSRGVYDAKGESVGVSLFESFDVFSDTSVSFSSHFDQFRSGLVKSVFGDIEIGSGNWRNLSKVSFTKSYSEYVFFNVDLISNHFSLGDRDETHFNIFFSFSVSF